MKRPYFHLLLLCIVWEIHGQCPIIQSQPSSQSDCDGNSIRMIVTSDADQYQWEKKRPSDSQFSPISGASSPQYQIYPSGGTLHPSGTLYRVKLSKNACQVYSQEASITLHSITSILNPSICERGSGTLIPQIPSTSLAQVQTYQWTRSINGGPFEDLVDDANFSGTKSKELIISQAMMGLNSQKIKVRINFSISSNNDNEGSLNNENQSSTCPRTSSEVSLQIKNTPIPSHASSLYKGCMDSPIAINSTGCSPYSTYWYDAQGQKIGEGARLTVNLSDASAHLFKATCFKNGCESLPSTGTSAQAFPVPAAPSNTGTPAQVCSGSVITFKASGGSNNLWYLNSSDKTTISTATSINVSQTTNLSQDALEITRWVSQKINECESPKTAIRVTVYPSLLADAGENKQLKGDELYHTTLYTTAIRGNPPYSYIWTSSNNTPITDNQASNPSIGPFRSSTYIKLLVKDQSNCIAKDSIYIQWENQVLLNPQDSVQTPSLPKDTTLVSLPEIGPDEGAPIPQNNDVLEEGTPEKPVPTWHEMSYTMEPLCQQNAYKIQVQGCPGNVMYFNQYGPEHLRAQGSEWIVDASFELFVQIRCSDPNSNVINLTIPVLKRPNFTIIKNFDRYVCQDQIAQIELDHLYKNQFVGWEKDGHFFSEAFILHQTLEAGQYQAIIQQNTCFYRSEILDIEVRIAPTVSSIIATKKSLCLLDSTLLQMDKPYPFVRWKTGENNPHIEFKAFQPGLFEFQAQVSQDNQCWSDWSESFTIQVHENPKQATIIAWPALGFCEGDSIQLKATSNYQGYLWNNGETRQTNVIKKIGWYGLKVQNQFGCWSVSSDSVLTYHYPEEPTPILKAIPSRQFCSGEIIQLQASKAYAYLWKNGSTEPNIPIIDSGSHWLKTQNQYGCWSKRSEEMVTYRRENPLTPAIRKSGIYFLEAISLDQPNEYEWKKDNQRLNENQALIKAKEMGLFEVRARKQYDLFQAPSLICFSSYQKISMSIPENMKGISIYPNPSKNGILHLELLEDIAEAEAKVFDFLGNEIVYYKLPSSSVPISLQLPPIPAGTYILKIIAPNYIKEKIIIISP
ncbi:T9SS type A sorting domain-containing protein [Aquirufa aurantiipilula]|uniref:T9SS type A sorting domain-containing protein n=1 Tax=Aquirufa aurantiipilula TaxID=2696561 RepID=A0ABT6BGJ4_9BACT|nr:T9SS type A sorting domain-containing protein [Aquirufa aurantiipilula]MDF5689567.1 T9SS type A sorting domain-containing protein [Aquirufa aurantiipilula]